MTWARRYLNQLSAELLIPHGKGSFTAGSCSDILNGSVGLALICADWYQDWKGRWLQDHDLFTFEGKREGPGTCKNCDPLIPRRVADPCSFYFTLSNSPLLPFHP